MEENKTRNICNLQNELHFEKKDLSLLLKIHESSKCFLDLFLINIEEEEEKNVFIHSFKQTLQLTRYL